MVVEEFTSFTISFVLNSPPCLLIMWLYHNFWPITSQNLHYYDNIVIVHCIGQMIYCNYISFLMQPFVFLEFVSVSFFYLFSLLCQLMFNSCHVLFEIYVIWLSVLFSSCPNPSVIPLPCSPFLMEISHWTGCFFSLAIQLSSWDWSLSLFCV